MKQLLYIFVFLSFLTSKGNTQSFEIKGNNYKYENLNTVTKPKALLVLFNGGSGIASKIAKETSIPDSASIRGVKTIGINQSELFLSDSNYTRIKTIISHVMKELSIKNVFMGGFSLGGMTTLRFTEIAVEKGDSAVIPKAVFSIDPPVDNVVLRNYCIKELNRQCSNQKDVNAGKIEAEWILNYYKSHFGEFEKDSSNYIKSSCYSVTKGDGGNAKYLLNIPIKMIHEINAMWQIKEKCRDLSDSNILTSSKMVNYLYNNGNKHATLELTQNKGKRLDGSIHPHSWSIADPSTTLDWLLSYIKN